MTMPAFAMQSGFSRAFVTLPVTCNEDVLQIELVVEYKVALNKHQLHHWLSVANQEIRCNFLSLSRLMV